MRRRPSSPLVRTTAAVISAVVLLGSLAGGAARSYGTPPPQPVDQAPAPAAPVNQLTSFDGLQNRVQQATDQARAAGADLKLAILDRNTGALISNGRADTPFPTASVVKLFIADDLLLQQSDGQTTLSLADRKSLDAMLRSSDDSAAQIFWDRSGGNAVITRIVARYGLTGTTAPYNGHWDVTTSTAHDLVRYYDMLLNGSGGLPPEQANVIMGNLAQSTPTGNDGYPQRFGIPDGLYAEPVAVKQGWFCCWSGANQLHVSTGVIGPERRYVMAVASLQPVGEAAARDTITQAVKTIFPGGRI